MKKTTLVLGASLNSSRYSNKAVRSLKIKSHNIIAVGLKSGEIQGVEVQSTKDYFTADKIAREVGTIDTVTLYISPKHQYQYIDYLIALKPRRIIFNPGTENIAFYDQLKKANIQFEVACTLVLLATNQY